MITTDNHEGTQLTANEAVDRGDGGLKQTALTNGHEVIGLINADALEGLRLLPSDTFHVVVTSPPYFWARDYGVEGQIGHEDTVDEYVSALADVFDEVQRVLHPEGTFYLNIGDTYYSGNGQPHGRDPKSPSRNFMRKKYRAVDQPGWDLPKKSMIGVPWRVAFELQERGWTLRNDIVWNRVNAFVEPTARDRPHRQWEHVFMFAKSRFYSYDRSELGDDEDVWEIPIDRNTRMDHNAPFPLELARRCILTGSPRGGYVLDPFVGSGTTLFAAWQAGRHSVGVDLNPEYTDAVCQYLFESLWVRTEWETLLDTLGKVSEYWDSWPGNKRNFRKPGTKKEN